MKEPSPTSSEESRAIRTPQQLKMESTGQLMNEAGGYTTDGFRKSYMLRKWHTFLSGEHTAAARATITSNAVECKPFSNFIFYLDAVADTVNAGDLLIEVQFSPDGNQWYPLQDGVFGGMTFVAAASQIKECYAGTMLGRYMRVQAYCASLQGIGWTVTASAEFLQP